MSRDAAEILRDALALPTDTRAALVDSLLDSQISGMTGDLVAFHAEAAAELEAAFVWYAARSSKVAAQYLAELDRAITVIRDRDPRRGAWPATTGYWRERDQQF